MGSGLTAFIGEEKLNDKYADCGVMDHDRPYRPSNRKAGAV
ncbi:hypothetical protein FH603_4045 [Spirosoma sp. LMG 31447]|uniref:Uncharacterized protein n=1 Tax=Spirosoma utsteinense TaxID=2585773 RepID=A0ABR6WC82_9BACT|nr:hypothetical protein [Spirosoma utsteinense]